MILPSGGISWNELGTGDAGMRGRKVSFNIFLMSPSKPTILVTTLHLSL